MKFSHFRTEAKAAFIRGNIETPLHADTISYRLADVVFRASQAGCSIDYLTDAIKEPEFFESIVNAAEKMYDSQSVTSERLSDGSWKINLRDLYEEFLRFVNEELEDISERPAIATVCDSIDKDENEVLGLLTSAVVKSLDTLKSDFTKHRTVVLTNSKQRVEKNLAENIDPKLKAKVHEILTTQLEGCTEADIANLIDSYMKQFRVPRNYF